MTSSKLSNLWTINMKLSYKQYSEQGSPVLVLHGLFGSQSNWGWHCKQLAKHFTVYGIDLRNHGDAPHADTMSYPEMAEDVKQLIEELQIAPVSIIGHSMGGKVGMQLALAAPELVAKLIVVDIAPVEYPAKNEGHMRIIQAMEALPVADLESRTQAEADLLESIEDEATRKFILTNLARDAEDQFSWRLNLPVIKAECDVLRRKLEADKPFLNQVLFVKGAESNYIHARNEAEILDLFPAAGVKIIHEAGHWVHADKPQTFQKIALDFLLSES